MKNKFRGKRVDNGEWVYGWLLGDNQPFIISNFITDYYTKKNMKCPNLRISDVFEVIPETVSQFVFICDKSKTAIFTKDIVKMDVHLDRTNGGWDGKGFVINGYYIGEVVLTSSGALLRNPIFHENSTGENISNKGMYKRIAGYRSTVIGNVIDNPELKEVQIG